jgi:hypothetical protein
MLHCRLLSRELSNWYAKFGQPRNGVFAFLRATGWIGVYWLAVVEVEEISAVLPRVAPTPT